MYAPISSKAQEARCAALKAEIACLEAELGANANADAIVKNHIQLLHRYNEAKDATQILIGRLAALRQSTIKQIHEDLDLRDSD